MTRLVFFTALGLLGSLRGYSQMHVVGNFSIGPAATVATPGDVISDADILGGGLLLLNGTASQQLDMNDNHLPKLWVKNPGGVSLTGDIRITDSLRLTDGKVLLGGSILIFTAPAGHSGADASRYLVTDGVGVVVKEGIDNGDSFTFPIGAGTAATDYTPVQVTSFTTSRSIGIQVKDYATSLSTEHNVSSGIDRTWQITSDISGAADISLTHNAATAGSAFNGGAAFVTQQLAPDGSQWSIGNPSPGTNGGLTHTGTFNIPAGLTPNAFFSKSSDAGQSLPVEEVESAHPQVQVLPNPFTDEAHLQINAVAEGSAQYRLSDITGRLVASGQLSLKKGLSSWPLPVGGLAPGAYTIHVSGSVRDASFTIIRR